MSSPEVNPPNSDNKSEKVAKSLDQSALVPRAEKSRGPRTPTGKERSSRNAIKHGIFARAALLDDESWEQFDSLLQGLRKDFRPKGVLENSLVDKLASLMWRYRRMLLAERAEIHLGKWVNPLKAVREKQQMEEALLFASAESPHPGLISRRENPLIRERIVELLKSLIIHIRARGFDREYDQWILRMIYGQNVINEALSLYLHCSNPLKEEELKGLDLTPGERKVLKEFDLPPAELRERFLDVLKQFKKNIEFSGERLSYIPARTERLERACTGVPEAPRLERLLRYEASLERNFDRTLNQLERLQRIRLGQPVPAPVNVNISSS